MLQVKNLSKTFKSHRSYQKALDDINVSFPEKGMVFIIGKSGSGKSTLLNMMAGLASPDKGEVLFNGRNVTKMKEKDLDSYHYQDIAFIFQNYCIMEELSVEENVALGKEENPRNIKDEIEDVLNKVGLLQQRKKKAKYLSGGEKQRVAIARAIVKKPSIIFSDEPTGNLDKQSSKDVLSILKEYSKEGLVIIVSHNLFDAYEYGDRIITLDQGKIIEDKSLSADKIIYPDVYLSASTFLNKEELDNLNYEIEKGNIPVFHSKEDAFIPTVENFESHTETEEKAKRSFFSPFISIQKAIGGNYLKTILFSFIISLVLIIFSATYYLGEYDGMDTGNSSYFKQSDTYILQKGYQDSLNGISSIKPSTLGIIKEEDEKTLHDSFPDEKPYKLYRYSHSYAAGYSGFEFGFNRNIALDSLNARHMKYGTGLLICKEDFIKKNLQISEIEYVNTAPVIKNSGVYITDYMADAYIANANKFYKSYDDVVGDLSSPNNSGVRISTIYINGIIKTDYKKKIPNILQYSESDNKDHSYLLYRNCQNETDYILNALSLYYTTNENFFDDVEKEETKKTITQYIMLTNSQDISLSQITHITYSSELKDDEAILPPDFIRAYLNENEDTFIEEYNKRSDSQKMSLFCYQYNASKSPLIDFSVFINQVRKLSDPEIKKKPSLPNKTITIVISKNAFYKLLKAISVPISYYFDSYSNAYRLYSVMRENDFYEKTLQTETNMNAAYYLNSLSPLLAFCAKFSLIATVIAIGSYSIFLIMDNRYQIGVLKAIGYKGNSLSIYFFIRLLLFLAATAILYLLFSQIFYAVINRLLTKAIYSTTNSQYSQPLFYFLYFIPKDFAFELIAVILLAALFELGYLYILRKIKVSTVLRHKD